MISLFYVNVLSVTVTLVSFIGLVGHLFIKWQSMGSTYEKVGAFWIEDYTCKLNLLYLQSL